MKKVFLTAIAALCAVGAWAAPVTVDRAKATATAFIKAKTGANVTVKEVVRATDTYYIINLNPGGWAIVSADDIAEPVIGFNTTGALNWHSIPQNMTGFIGNLEAKTDFARRNGLKARNANWKNLSTPQGMARISRADDDASIPDLIKVNFNQTPPFNKYCPGTGNNKAIVGCPAVSMAQAMTVQQYPAQPQGKNSYSCAGYGLLEINYDAEKPYNWDNILHGRNDQYDEAARLLYHCGVSVNMNYGPDGSGIPSNEVSRWINALANNFGYNKDDLKYYWRTSYRGDWEALVLNELNAGRAVIYNAIDSKGHYGHSFNVDGYRGDKYYHLNWGWGGVGNGYFRLDALQDAAMDMNYDSGHVVVIGIGSPNQVLKNIELSDIVIDEKLPAGTVLAQITVNGAAPESTYKLSIFGAYDKRTGTYAEVPFELDGDLLKTKSVLAAQDEPIELNVRVEDTATSTRLQSSFMITVCPLRTIAAATSLTYDRTTGELLIKTRNGLDYTLTGPDGSRISGGSLSPVPHLTIRKAELPDGESTLTLTSGSQSKVLKIKK